MLARVLPALVALLVAVGLAGCGSEEADTTDADRIATMRADAIYGHMVGDAEAIAGGRTAAPSS